MTENGDKTTGDQEPEDQEAVVSIRPQHIVSIELSELQKKQLFDLTGEEIEMLQITVEELSDLASVLVN